MTADVLVHPNKEHSDEVHQPPTHSVAADVQELPSDDYADEVYLSHIPPTVTNVQEPHTFVHSNEVNPLLTPCDMQRFPRGNSEENILLGHSKGSSIKIKEN